MRIVEKIKGTKTTPGFIDAVEIRCVLYLDEVYICANDLKYVLSETENIVVDAKARNQVEKLKNAIVGFIISSRQVATKVVKEYDDSTT